MGKLNGAHRLVEYDSGSGRREADTGYDVDEPRGRSAQRNKPVSHRKDEAPVTSPIGDA